MRHDQGVLCIASALLLLTLSGVSCSEAGSASGNRAATADSADVSRRLELIWSGLASESSDARATALQALSADGALAFESFPATWISGGEASDLWLFPSGGLVEFESGQILVIAVALDEFVGRSTSDPAEDAALLWSVEQLGTQFWNAASSLTTAEGSSARTNDFIYLERLGVRNSTRAYATLLRQIALERLRAIETEEVDQVELALAQDALVQERKILGDGYRETTAFMRRQVGGR
ncbi:MAG: hypothetical protein DWH96_04710 [Planctomycetota bacterium]|nr:MAG: hypothetical protein DWH96_04710 [Planctomycetota bacterium]RLS94281.1 MAG: hypothetical protein DWI11_05285 [Planctomycetota bacterium]